MKNERYHGRIIQLALLMLPTGPIGAQPAPANLALVATPATSFVSGHETLAALNDGHTPAHSDDKRHGAYGNWPRTGTQWVEYEWRHPVKTRQIEVYWFDDHRGVRLPKACRLKYWDGQALVEAPQAAGLGLEANKFNVTTFPELTTTRLRLEFDGQEKFSTGLLEWRVLDAGGSPNFPPAVEAGVDRVAMLPGRTHLEGWVRDDGRVQAPRLLWSKESGPGTVTFDDASAAATAARFTMPGEYQLKLSADDGQWKSFDTVRVRVEPMPPKGRLGETPMQTWTVTSGFWRPRLKNQIVNWIPHCIRKIEDPQTKEGGLENFVQAARKLAGQSDARHIGPVFANTWTYNTFESMCWALMLDPAGDPEILAAQALMRRTVEDWLPKLIGAQEPDGYIHTQYTIQGRKRWSNKHDHEGYMAGYFIEAGLAHHRLTSGRDPRLYEAAKRLADCWVRNIGPAPKRAWYEGHQELELALAKLARYVDEHEGAGKGKPYLELAQFLLDSRRNGEEYDQSHAPVTRQYEAVGHAVRAVYSYCGMADVAAATGDVDYHSAVQSLWFSIVNRKYYVTGGVGSGETAEGFGKEFSLPNHSYCESCANCGELFFQHRLNATWREAKYADLLEETLYNGVLGSVDLEGKNFTYTNPLDSGGKRYLWHGCPCCVGNIPRTLLQLPVWTYARDAQSLYVNLFVGGTVTVPGVAGTTVRVTQTTDYPWSGKVVMALDPATAKAFELKIRAPDYSVSELYTNSPSGGGLGAVAVNGKPVKPNFKNGYAVISRKWKAGDQVEFEVPLAVQRVKADQRIAATRGRVALRYGPLIYNVESVDQEVEGVLKPEAALTAEWRGDLLGGVMVIKGTWAGGNPLLAIPNYSRLNRGGRSLVWIKDQ